MIDILAVLVALGASAPAPRSSLLRAPIIVEAQAPGTLTDVERYVRAALTAPGGQSILVIHVSAPGDFVQLTGEAGAAQFSFPLVTPRQRSDEDSLRTVLAELHLSVHESPGSNGMRFLDVAAGSDVHRVASVTRTLLRRLHGVTAKTPLEFECQGCGTPGARAPGR
ncbi:MAG TPA: hypothetical protein VIC55_03920 [Gemmatimonadaceae bacterium]|jgi:hypothetical protein